ncbi:MAG: HupE/UreJ family protein [Betaproteobacteria bacterium]|nr:HupE/UreJ family protein [Betaproteobacteria bacterium]
MKYSSRYLKFLQLAALALFALGLPSLAHAHVGAGHSSGWIHGLAHPVGGLDHVCAMIAVGLWAAQMGGRAVWLVPLTFVTVMALGGALGMAAVPVVYTEQGIVMSLLVLGVLIAAAVRLPLAVSAAVVGVFALCHGYAHGTEMPQSTSGLAYAAGFMLSTSLLQASGIGMALLAGKTGRAEWLRLTGVAITLCGGGLLFAG